MRRGSSVIIYNRDGEKVTEVISINAACRYIYGEQIGKHFAGSVFKSLKDFSTARVNDSYFIGIGKNLRTHTLFITPYITRRKRESLTKKKQAYFERRDKVLSARYNSRVFVLDGDFNIIKIHEGTHTRLAELEGMTTGAMKKYLSDERAENIVRTKSPFTFNQNYSRRRIYMRARQYYKYAALIKVYQEAKSIKEKFDKEKVVFRRCPKTEYKRPKDSAFYKLTKHIKS